jgi:competence CoiA-like predicted nuclease
MNDTRKIEIAFDKISNKVLRTEDIFGTYHEAYKVRREFHEKKYDFTCCECGQKLEVSTSKNGLVHFRHAKGTGECVLKESKFTEYEMEQIKEFHLIRESERHIELKNKIGHLIANEDGVKNVHIDNKVVFDQGNRRRPDVICSYKNMTIVFEIQLSYLPLSYMLERVKFYNSKNYFLIWILDNIDLESQNQMVKDIKYLHPSHNFFSLDEHSNIFRLNCNYKWAYLNENDRIRYKWKSKSVSLHQLTFKKGKYEVYFFDFQYRVSQLEEEIKNQLAIREEYEQELALELKEDQVSRIIRDIKQNKQEKRYDYTEIDTDIKMLDFGQKRLLNEKLNISGRVRKPAIHMWISKADNDDLNFLKFIFLCDTIAYDINQKDYKERSVLNILINNQQIKYKEFLFRYLVYRGYQINLKDEKLLIEYYQDKVVSDLMITFFKSCLKMDDPQIRQDLYEHRKFLCILESIKKNEIIGFDYRKGNWLQFANNAITHYANNWKIIRLAFEHYELWNTIVKSDKKGSLAKKLKNFNLISSSRDGFENTFLVAELYPELKGKLPNVFY